MVLIDCLPCSWGGHLDGLNSFFHAEPVKGAGQVETMMYFVLKLMNFVSKNMDFVFTMRAGGKL